MRLAILHTLICVLEEEVKNFIHAALYQFLLENPPILGKIVEVAADAPMDSGTLHAIREATTEDVVQWVGY